MSLDDGAKQGKGTQLVRVDPTTIPVYLEGYYILGLRWGEKIYVVDCSLPFKLRSAPKIFGVAVDMLTWDYTGLIQKTSYTS